VSPSSDLLLTREWIEAAALLAVSLIAIAILKRFLSRARLKPAWAWVHTLVPAILNLGYVIALGIFLQAAPLGSRWSVWAEHVSYVLTLWMFLILVRQALMRAAEWGTRSSRGSAALQHGFIPLIKNVSTLFVFVMGGIMVLKHFGYDVMSLLTALGVGSLAVGLAAKEALSNMISGFVLIMDRNLAAGDRISLGGITGDVEEIGLRSTRIRTGEGNTMIVPNFDLVNNRIINLSDPSRASTCTTQIRVPYIADFERVSTICTKILSGIPQVDHSKDPWVNLASLADGSQLIAIGCWLREMDDAGAVLTALNKQLLQVFKTEQIPLIEPPLLPH